MEIVPDKRNELKVVLNRNAGYICYGTQQTNVMNAIDEFIDECCRIGIDVDNLDIDYVVLLDDVDIELGRFNFNGR